MNDSFLGQGIKFPLELVNGVVQLQSGKDLIKQSIRAIINTPVGTRFFLPEYGSRLRELLFEPNDEVLRDLIRFFVKEALDWEKRVRYIDCKVDINVDSVSCIVEYQILRSNEIDSFIFPFYRALKY